MFFSYNNEYWLFHLCGMLFTILKNIRFNHFTKMHVANEAGKKYEIDPMLLDDLGVYLKDDPLKLIADWYRQLSEEKKKLVKVT